MQSSDSSTEITKLANLQKLSKSEGPLKRAIAKINFPRLSELKEELKNSKFPCNYYMIISIIVLLISIAVSLFIYTIYLLKELFRNRTVIYTCITDPEGALPQIVNYTKTFDYVVFTDNHYYSRNWTYRKIPDKLKGLPKIKIEQYIKLMAHEFFQDYEVSIWVDHKVTIVGNLTEYLVRYLNPIDCVYMPQHPTYKSIFKEGMKLIRSGKYKDTGGLLEKKLKRYEKEKMPQMTGVPESRLIIRFHNYLNSTIMMNTWWNELKDGPDTDDFLFSYVLWKTNMDIKYMPMLFYHKEYIDAGPFD